MAFLNFLEIVQTAEIKLFFYKFSQVIIEETNFFLSNKLIIVLSYLRLIFELCKMSCFNIENNYN